VNRALWIVQGLLAVVFLFAGSVKLVMPVELMTDQMALPLPGAFIRFIGIAEVLGACGLILPSLLRIRPRLTPLAAAGLVSIMLGATAISLLADPASALLPLLVGLLATFVGYGRVRLVPVTPASRRPLTPPRPRRIVQPS